MRSSMGRGFSSDIRDDITVAIHQPCFLPYYGYFQKIYESDVFVFLDDTQFSNDNYQQYNYIVTPQGLNKVSVPLDKHFGSKICDTNVIYDTDWVARLEKKITFNYKRAKHYKEVAEVLYQTLRSEPQTLSELNINIITQITQRMGIKTRYIRSSQIEKEGRSTEQLLSIAKAVNATAYLSGVGAKAYQDEGMFNDIQLKYIELKPPIYQQLWGKEEKNPSFLDYLMNEGFKTPERWITT